VSERSLWDHTKEPDNAYKPAEAEEVMNLIAEEKQAPIFARAVSADKEMVAARLAELEKKAIEVANSLAIEVKDQATYDLAAFNFNAAKTFIDDTNEYIEPFRIVTYNLYQKVMNRKKAIITPTLEANLKNCGRAILAFERAKEEEHRLAQIESDRKAREEEETRRLNMAAAAEKAGMSTESVERILETPSAAPRPVAAPTFQKAENLGKTRENWQAEPIGSPLEALMALVKAAGKKEGKHLLAYLQVNHSALNAHAKATKTAMQIPGYKAVDQGTLVRSR
jgi:hypothetical protein